MVSGADEAGDVGNGSTALELAAGIGCCVAGVTAACVDAGPGCAPGRTAAADGTGVGGAAGTSTGVTAAGG